MDVDFRQTYTQRSLSQTTLQYVDPKTNKKYLVFVDVLMELFVYELTTLLMDNSFGKDALVNVPLFFSKDISNPNYVKDSSRECTNMVQTDENHMIMTCLAAGGSGDDTTFVSIDLTDLTQGSISQSYVISKNISFSSMREGKFTVLRYNQSSPSLIISKENKTACYFDILQFDGVTPPQLIRRITQFYEPPLNETEETNVAVDVPLVSSCKMQSIPPLFNDEDRYQIPFLQIQDVEAVPYFDDVVVASDFNYGLLFMKIVCNTTQMKCQYKPLAMIKETQLSEVTVMTQLGNIQDQMIFAQKVNPPWILEIMYDKETQPAIKRIYTVASDEGQFIGFGMVDANQDYILAQLFSNKLLRPIFRVYKRSDSFFSIVHTEIDYTEFTDQGVLGMFLNVQFNFFLIKTSDKFSIYKARQHNLILSTADIGPEYLDQTFEVALSVKNGSFMELKPQPSFNITILQQSTEAFRVMRKYESDMRDEPVRFTYNCGEKSMKISIDELFEGDMRVDLVLKDKNPEHLQRLFQLSTYQTSQLELILLNRTGCIVNAIIDTVSPIRKEQMLQCIQNNNTVIYLELESVRNKNAKELQKVMVPTAKFVDINYDEINRELFLLSDRNQSGKAAAIIHILEQHNKLGWKNVLDLNQNYPELNQDFIFKQTNAMSYQKGTKRGTLISKPDERNGYQVTTLLLFSLNTNSMESDIKIIGKTMISLPISRNQVIVSFSKVDRFGNTWVALSNQTLKFYTHPVYKVDQDEITKIYQKREYNFTLLSQIEPKDPLYDFIIFKESENVDKFLFFFGDNKLLLMRSVRASTELEEIMLLPLDYGENDPDRMISRYVMVRSQGNLAPTQERFEDQLVFTLFRNVSSADGSYFIFVHDIMKPKHGSLILKKELDKQFKVDPQFSKFQLLDKGQSIIEVYLFINESAIVTFSFKYINEIELTSEDRSNLIQACTQDSIELEYLIYPETDPNQNATIIIEAKNNGLVIIPNSQSDSLIVTNGGQTSYRANTRLEKNNNTAEYSLARSFKGNNIQYEMECADTDDCSSVVIPPVMKITDQKDIEVLSSSNRLLGFFIVEPALLFYSEKRLNLIFLENSKPVVREYKNMVHKSSPIMFDLKTFTDPDKNKINILVVQTEDFSVGLELIISISQFKNFSSHYALSNFDNIENQIYFNDPRELLRYSWRITLTELYLFNQDETFEQRNRAFNVKAVLACSDDERVFNSIIRIYDIVFQEKAGYKAQRAKGSGPKTLSVNRLNLDSFNINSMSLIGNSTLLAIGIQNFGVIIYDILTYRLVAERSIIDEYQSTSLQKLRQSTQFYVSHIVSLVDQMGIYVVLNNNAVYFMKQDDDENNSGMRIVPTFIENSESLGNSSELAISDLGFAFIQDTLVNKSIMFFSPFAPKNSKFIGQIMLADNDNCKYLRSMPISMAKQAFAGLKEINDEFMITASICSYSYLKINAYDMNPSISINISHDNSLLEYSRKIAIVAKNTFDANSSHTPKFILDVRVIDKERNVDPQLYIAYAILPLLIFVLLLVLNKKTMEMEKEIEKAESMAALPDHGDFSKIFKSDTTSNTTYRKKFADVHDSRTEMSIGNYNFETVTSNTVLSENSLKKVKFLF